jgi:hypothetical protein
MEMTTIDLSNLPPASEEELAKWEKKLILMGYAGRLRSFLDELAPQIAVNNPVIREMQREYNSQLGSELQQIRAGIRLLYAMLDALMLELGLTGSDTVLTTFARSPRVYMLEKMVNTLLEHDALTVDQMVAMLRTIIRLESHGNSPPVEVAKVLASLEAKHSDRQSARTMFRNRQRREKLYSWKIRAKDKAVPWLRPASPPSLLQRVWVWFSQPPSVSANLASPAE